MPPARSNSQRRDHCINAGDNAGLAESGEIAMLFRVALALVSMTALLVDPIEAVSQDMLRSVDLDGPEMSTSEMTRAEVEALLEAAPQDATGQRSPDLQGRRLSHLDLSGLDFSGGNLRLVKLNRTNLKRARFDRAILNQAWLIDADLTGGIPRKGIAAWHADATRQAGRR